VRRRIGRERRTTRETDIALTLDLDGGRSSIRTPVPFLDHMLTLAAAHGGLALSLKASGDVQVDDHHVVEDVGICLGRALLKALGDKKGMRRYGSATVPMDESLVLAALDLSGRPHLSYGLRPSARRIKTFDTALVREFFEGFVREARCTLHLRQLTRGGNAHHEVEAAFKAFGRALGEAVSRTGAFRGVPSTKGLL
jgi:imidazoleglycerol-phosphate dehydratase